jgi:opacity protein-like surface antigen
VEFSHSEVEANSLALFDNAAGFLFKKSVSGDLDFWTFMGNVVARTHWGPSFQPYVGVGGGGTLIDNDIVIFPGTTGVSDSDFAGAAQAFVGFDFALTRNFSVGARYSIAYIGPTNFSDYQGDPVNADSATLQSVKVTLKHFFGGPRAP